MQLLRFKNPYLLFLPFLFLYFILVIIHPTKGNQGDEGRYLMFANNLLHGFYSPPPPEINIWNGPGYPLLLMPFVALHLPLMAITLLNSLLYYFSIILLYKSLQKFVSNNKTIFISLCWACYYISFFEMSLILSEVFTSFLITLLILNILQAYNLDKQSKKHAIYSGLIIAYIVLTKVIFSYVLIFMLVGSGLLYLLYKKAFNYKRSLLILIIAFAGILPYIIYTYHLTNKIYYFGDSGGMSLYWMSSPFENEVGDWQHERELHANNSADSSIINSDTKTIPGWNNYLYINHYKDYQLLDNYVGVQRDDMYKKLAFNNIKTHPGKFVKNCISNAQRLFYSFPYSYTLQRNNFRLPLTQFLVVGIFICGLFSVINWRKLPFPLRFLLILLLSYLCLTILVSTYTRMLTVVVPILLFWFAYTFQKSIIISLKMNAGANKD